jgi:hypothetical protein
VGIGHNSRVQQLGEPMGGWPKGPWDWAWLPDDPNSGLSARYWTYRDQERFESVWTPRGDALAHALADGYAFAWPWLTAEALKNREPSLASALYELAASGRVATSYYQSGNPDAVYDHLAQYGPFHALRRKRTWSGPALLDQEMLKQSQV